MTIWNIHINGPIKLPSDITVGDEFRVAGKVRVTAIAEDTVEATPFGEDPSSITLPGERTITIGIGHIEPLEHIPPKVAR